MSEPIYRIPAIFGQNTVSHFNWKGTQLSFLRVHLTQVTVCLLFGLKCAENQLQDVGVCGAAADSVLTQEKQRKATCALSL